MTLLFIEGFEGWGVTNGSAPDNSMQRRWAVPTDFSWMDVEAGRIAGHSIEWPLSFDRLCTSPDLGANTTLYAGFGFKCNALGAKIIFSFIEPGSVLGINIGLTAAGELAIYRGTTLIDTTAGLGLVANTWYYIECKVFIHASAGAYDLHVGEVSVLANSSLDTMAGATAELRQICINGSVIVPWFDDIYVNNSGFFGNCRVDALFPDAAVAGEANWAPDTGVNVDRIKEVVPDDDSSYVEDDTAAQRDLYEYESAPGGIGNILGIQIATECRETDATTFTLITVIKSSATVSNDGGQVLGSTSYVEKRRISETDPDTAAAWTTSGLNAAQFGVEVG